MSAQAKLGEKGEYGASTTIHKGLRVVTGPLHKFGNTAQSSGHVVKRITIYFVMPPARAMLFDLIKIYTNLINLLFFDMINVILKCI